MMGGNDLQHGPVQESVAGDNTCSGDGQWLAASGGDLAARLLDEEAAGREVPRGELVLEEAPKAPSPT